MFKRMFIILGISLFLVTNLTFAGRKTVVDFYNQIINKNKIQDLYKIKKKNSTWITRSSSGQNLIVQTVDLRTGYIRYTVGHGAGVVVAALFRKSNGRYILGVNEHTSAGVLYSKSEIKFFLFKRNKIYNVTKKVIPDVNYKYFFNAKAVKKFRKASKRIKQYIKTVYTLPRSGTTAFVTYEFNKLEYISMYGTENEQKIAGFLLSNIKYKQIPLKWDRKRGRFKIPKKYKR